MEENFEKKGSELIYEVKELLSGIMTESERSKPQNIPSISTSNAIVKDLIAESNQLYAASLSKNQEIAYLKEKVGSVSATLKGAKLNDSLGSLNT